ncbi:DUF2061 domain-containing protein [uncultured Caulobacter sp.]|uniref:DUF2061 domain-containing protein n=1 Tax=uncultured Caulobacter sp. TaxID=158749 RepID=UPI00262E59FF|nr:DUF2061 domain-containing protein [uncultured Caulobacter sp.]
MNRTLMKTCTYGVMHLTVAVTVAFVLTHDWRIALAVGVVEPLVQTLAFVVHERCWSKAGDIKVAPLCGHAHGPEPAS